MKPELVLFQFPQCPFCAYVLAEIRRLNVDVELKNTRENPKHREELVKRTGKTQVPCLFIDGKPMHESSDIVAYLRSHFSGK